ncbi:YabP/YqfC family sporulation protein, partial [Alicyclobacillus fodiniaquatilis]|jgi:sporulation protein YabP
MGVGDQHDVRLIGRADLEITGVQSVASFDVHAFELHTNAGALHIVGDNLHMKHFDVQAGVVRIEGRIIGLQYNDEGKRRNFVGRLLK